MEWKELVAPPVLASILEKAFFPKWMQVLTLWLNHAPDYDEVTNWYCGWKTMLPDCLRSQPAVSGESRPFVAHFCRAG
jgi:tuftelin-interacting protein 11